MKAFKKKEFILSEDEQTSERKAGDCPQTAKLFEGKTTMIADSSTTVMEALKLLPQSPDKQL